jgi:hypothetical protein
MELKTNMIDHIHFFLRKIKTKQPFSLIRPSDGEYLILKNNEFTNTDNWTHKKGTMDKELYEAVSKSTKMKNIFIGIPCPDCNKEIYDYYMKEFDIPKNKLTYANVVCNRNFRIFVSFLIETKTPFCYIGPGENDSSELNVINRFKVDEKLVDNWKEQKDDFKVRLFNWFEENINKTDVFMFSVGPITKIVIPDLAEKYPHKTFIDAGSTLDIFLKGSTNRLYVHHTQPYSNQCCDHVNGHKEEPEITCILTGYKRPQHLSEQIESLRKQTIKPKEIIIWLNDPNFKLPEDIDPEIHVVRSTKNFGVWARFACALLANTKYICIFDDDTIPGPRWLENCYETMKHFDGLLGTVGVVFKNNGLYDIAYRVGWSDPVNGVSKVDIVGHSWFFKREWLQYLWSLQPNYDFDEQLVCGEDIGFSCALQKVGIETFVPPHPQGHEEFFGSIPSKAWNYGTENVGVSMQHGIYDKFSRALNYYVKEHGFKLINT